MPEFSNDNSAVFGGLLTVHFLLTKEERKVEASEITNGHLNENDVRIGNGNGVENGNGHIDQEMINMVNFLATVRNRNDSQLPYFLKVSSKTYSPSESEPTILVYQFGQIFFQGLEV